jgi:hypothetical protein
MYYGLVSIKESSNILDIFSFFWVEMKLIDETQFGV